MQALIFDMDGVMIDSELHWQDDEWSMIAKMIPHWKESDHARIIGRSIKDIYRLLVEDYGLKIPEADFMGHVDKIADKIYSEEANLMDGLLDVLNALKGRVPMAMASSAKRGWIEQTVRRFSLEPFFKTIVSAEDIKGPGKPAPDIYLATAKKLGVPPAKCWVIEDSKNGVLSARAAGMKVIGFRNGFNQNQDLSIADLEIMGFKNLDLTQIAS